MMKKSFLRPISIAGLLLLAVMTGASSSTQTESSIQTFWTQFKSAVTKADKNAIATMSEFPIIMPFGHRAIKTKSDLVQRYRDVFNGETNAAKCFAGAKPEVESDNKDRFTVGCKNSAGQEVIVYGFVRTKAGWKFKSLDNINE